jgi:hypothetical protein
VPKLYPDRNQLQRLHSHAWLALFDNHFDKNSIQAEARVYGAKCVALARAEVRDDPNDATAKRDLGSLASPVGALRMEASNSPNPLHPSLINIKIHLGADNVPYV